MAKRWRHVYGAFIAAGFTTLEAKAFSQLPLKSPVVKLMIKERQERRNRFEHFAVTMIAQGKWKATNSTIEKKWIANLSRLYTKHPWRVRTGKTKGKPNPWALYRSALGRTGGEKSKMYTSPWEARQLSKGRGVLDKGLIFVQRQERQERGKVNVAQIRRWIAEKDEAIRSAKGANRATLVIQRNRLERLANRQN